MQERVKIPVGGKSVTATIYRAADPGGVWCVLGHGAGTDQWHEAMVSYAEGLSARGIDVVTFNFLYREEKRGMPDRAPQLEACFRAVIDAVRPHFDGALVIGGRSMGGRMATHLAAQGLDGLSALVLLGYPLHPPKKPEQLRVAHLPDVKVPALFVQGVRDEFGSPDELRPHLARTPRAEIFAVEKAGHSLPASAPILDEIARWLYALRFLRKRPNADV